MKTAQEIQQGLANFYGTEQWHTYYPKFLLTDGVKWLADNAECYWLIDIIWSYQWACKKDEMLRDCQFWTLTVDQNKSAKIICERDSGDIAFSQDIPYTDFPLDNIKIWVESSGEGMVVLLPNEH